MAVRSPLARSPRTTFDGSLLLLFGSAMLFVGCYVVDHRVLTNKHL